MSPLGLGQLEKNTICLMHAHTLTEYKQKCESA